MKPEKVIVIGGGIGGLAFALALYRAGIAVEVYERAPELKEVGAGLGVWANAVRVLNRLGAGERVRELGNAIEFAELCNDKGQTLSSMNNKQVVSDNSPSLYIMRRSDLLNLIYEQLPSDIVKTGHECARVEENEKGVTAHFANGTKTEGTILVGADGINSIVRKTLWNDGKPRYSGQTCFRGLANFKLKDTDTLREIQGTGKRAGVCPLKNENVYWFTVVNAPEGKIIPFEERQSFLLKEFDSWLYQVPEIIAATESENIYQNDLVDRIPIKQWNKGRMTLLGDAAHPTTPNLGQGARAAIGDAMVLTRMLLQHKTHKEAFNAYEKERLARTTRIVNLSWNFGRMAGWENSFAVTLHELMARATPTFLMEKEFRNQVGYDAGDLPQW